VTPFAELCQSVERLVNDFTATLKEVEPQDLGLDERCGKLYVSDETIATRKIRDKSLRYYGGFEYVDDSYRIEVSDWVFYLAICPRVGDHLERLQVKEAA